MEKTNEDIANISIETLQKKLGLNYGEAAKFWR